MWQRNKEKIASKKGNVLKKEAASEEKRHFGISFISCQDSTLPLYTESAYMSSTCSQHKVLKESRKIRN